MTPGTGVAGLKPTSISFQKMIPLFLATCRPACWHPPWGAGILRGEVSEINVHDYKL